MWWLYVKIVDNERQCVYLYNRESREPDGEIVYDKKRGKWQVTRPCLKDYVHREYIAVAERQFRHVVAEGFPNTWTAVMG